MYMQNIAHIMHECIEMSVFNHIPANVFLFVRQMQIFLGDINAIIY